MISLYRKTATAALLSLSVIGFSTVHAAADEHAAHHPATDTKAATDTPAAPADAMANMKTMQEQMSAIRATKDPKGRAKLMDEHMKTMQNTMKLMQQDKGCMMMDKGGSSGGMGMMQMMMEQMMQHQKAMQGSDK